jgi:hypothetical protein
MRIAILAFAVLLSSAAHAQAADPTAVGQCTLVVDGKQVWNGKCCLTTTAKSFSTPGADLHAEGWGECVYDRRHPENANEPGYMQKCFGPWINLSLDDDQAKPASSAYSGYWSIEAACHGGMNFPAIREGNTYKGEKFTFTWREVGGK